MQRNKQLPRYTKPLTSLRWLVLCFSLVLVTLLAHEPKITSAISQDHKPTSEGQKFVVEAEALRADWKASSLREAIQKYDQAVAMFTAVSDFSSASLTTLEAGDVSFILSEFTEALKRYETAARLAENGGNRVAQGRALSKMGLVNSYIGNKELARLQAGKALTLLKVAENDPNLAAKSAYGEALINMAEVTRLRGNFAKVLVQLDEARRFLDHDWEAQARIHLITANTVGSLGDAEKALAEADRAIEFYKAKNNKVGEGLALVARALFYAFEGPAEPAIPILGAAAEIFHSIGDRHSEAIAMNALGQTYRSLGNRQLAISYFEKGLRLFESVGSLNAVAGTNFVLATMYLVENPARAQVYYDRCVFLSRAAGDVRTEANALSEIALALASQKRPDEAARQHRKAQTLYEKIGDRRGQVTALNRYGDFLLRLNQKKQALELFNQALPVIEQVGDTSILLDTLLNIARTHVALGDYEAGLEVVEKSLKIIEEVRGGVRTPDLRTLYFSGVRRHYELSIDILMQLDRQRPNSGFGARAFLMSEKSRARSLVDLVRETRSTWREGATPDDLRREREIIGRIQAMSEYRLSLSLNDQKDAVEESEVDTQMAQLNSELYSLQAALSAKNPTQTALAEFELKDIAQVQQVLPADGTMLLEYALGDERSYLWAITSNSFQSYELPSRQNIEAAARDVYELITARQQPNNSDYQAKVEQADNQFIEKAASLSQTLLGPVASQLRNRRLLIVSEGALQLAPFDALPVPTSQVAGSSQSTAPVLASTNEIASLPSVSTLLAMRAATNRRASSGKLVAVIADPVFSASDDRVKPGSSTTAHAANLSNAQQPAKEPARIPSRLIYSSEEADAITKATPYGSTFVAKGFDASRETVMSSAIGEYQIVHFATHGFLDTDHPELSAVVLTMVDQNGAEQIGLMPLNDIYNLDLGAELTVLSACQTALGTDIKGEGLIGLTHGFLSAGSKSVVASLWKVDDRATAKLMAHFYEAMLEQKLPPSAALRAAKLKMMQDKQFSASYYWAGFVFQGDYESRINVESKTRLVLGLGLLLLVLISLGLLIFLRRRRSSPVERN